MEGENARDFKQYNTTKQQQQQATAAEVTNDSLKVPKIGSMDKIIVVDTHQSHA